MSKKKILIKEGLYYDEFVIKGDNDYIELCNDIMENYNKLERDVIKYKNKYIECKLELDEIKFNVGYEMNKYGMFEFWCNKKIEYLKKREKKLEKRELKIYKLNSNLMKENKYITNNLRLLNIKNRFLRIKLINKNKNKNKNKKIIY
jgi:hypothetical protein